MSHPEEIWGYQFQLGILEAHKAEFWLGLRGERSPLSSVNVFTPNLEIYRKSHLLIIFSDIFLDPPIDPIDPPVVSYLEWLPPIKLLKHLITWSCKIQEKPKPLFFVTVSMTTKLDRIVTYLDGLLPIKSHDSLITWPC